MPQDTPPPSGPIPPAPGTASPAPTAAASPRDRAAGIIAFAVVLTLLYLGRDVLIPLTLALMLSLLIAPLVRALRSIGLGQTGSVLVAVLALAMLCAATAGSAGHPGTAHGREPPPVPGDDPTETPQPRRTDRRPPEHAHERGHPPDRQSRHRGHCHADHAT